MSIKPVDFQVMVPRTTEVSKIHNDEQHKNAAVQQQATTMTQTKADSNTRAVYSQERTQEARIREKREGSQGGKKDKKKKNKKQDTNTSTIDIRL